MKKRPRNLRCNAISLLTILFHVSSWLCFDCLQLWSWPFSGSICILQWNSSSWVCFILWDLQSEVEILSKLQHPNIISLLGYSTNDTARFIVYELMPNVSLESHLHGTETDYIFLLKLWAWKIETFCLNFCFLGSSQGSAITWPMRMKIALDVTRWAFVFELTTFHNLDD